MADGIPLSATPTVSSAIATAAERADFARTPRAARTFFSGLLIVRSSAIRYNLKSGGFGSGKEQPNQDECLARMSGNQAVP